LTCIIGHRHGWMVADRLVTFGGATGPFKASKIARSANDLTRGLVGSAGKSLQALLISDAIGENYDRFVSLQDRVCKAIREQKEPSGDALIVTPTQLAYVDSAGCLHELEERQSFWAIGSGAEMAIGYLGAWERCCGRELDPHAAEAAIQYVSVHDNTVGSFGFQVERL